MAKGEEDESAEAAGARAKDLAGKARKASKAKASEVFVAEAPQDALAKPSQREVAEAMGESSAEIEEEGKAEAEVGHMIDSIDTVQKLGTEQVGSSTIAVSSFLEIVQAIAAEASDYSRRSLERRSSFVEKLFCATSFESALLIQSEYARTSYAGLITYLRKMDELYTNLVKEAVKPFEEAIANFQR